MTGGHRCHFLQGQLLQKEGKGINCTEEKKAGKPGVVVFREREAKRHTQLYYLRFRRIGVSVHCLEYPAFGVIYSESHRILSIC